MAGRIRTVKPEWLEDEKLSMASLEARVLSVAALLLADDHGRGRAHPAHVGSSVFPTHNDATGLARKALDDLADAGFLVLYEVRGQSYYEVRNWKKHQRVDKPGAPRVPAPDDPEAVPSSHSRIPRESLANDSRPIRESVLHAPGKPAQDDADPGNSAADDHSRIPRESLANDSRLISDLRSPISDPDHRSPTVSPRDGGATRKNLDLEALEILRTELGDLFATIRDPATLVLQLLEKARVANGQPDRREVIRQAARAVARTRPEKVAGMLHSQVEQLREPGALERLLNLEAAIAEPGPETAPAPFVRKTARKAETWG